MTYGNCEGYLVHLDGNEAQIIYCILDEGIFQYFSSRGGELLGVIPLTGAKIEVYLTPDSKKRMTHQFHISATLWPAKSPSVAPLHKNPSMSERLIATRQKMRTTYSMRLAASSDDVAHQWALNVLNWNRGGWEDASTILCSTKDEVAALTALLSFTTCNVKSEPRIPSGISPAIKPL